MLEFPLEFLRRCTNGFDNESRLEGEGAFGKVRLSLFVLLSFFFLFFLLIYWFLNTLVQVYRAVDPLSGVTFAVKRLKNDGLTETQRESAMKSMQRELEVLKAISHPNMIRLLGFCTAEASEGNLCLLYELGTHGSLAKCLEDDACAARMTAKVRTRILGAISAALNYLHQSHDPPVYHRDIKSANIVICEGMVPKIIDCGLAKLLTDEETEARNRGKSVFTVGATGGGRLGTRKCRCAYYLPLFGLNLTTPGTHTQRNTRARNT